MLDLPGAAAIIVTAADGRHGSRFQLAPKCWMPVTAKHPNVLTQQHPDDATLPQGGRSPLIQLTAAA
ncbi:hypothetical protein [Mycobacterium gordonae]|jgi:hypothetical protein|nr:hypothetical protein [Mycobacterium gordonae]